MSSDHHGQTWRDDVTLGRWGAPSAELAEQLEGVGLSFDAGRGEVLEVADHTHAVRRVYVRPVGGIGTGYAAQFLLPGPARPRARRGEEE